MTNRDEDELWRSIVANYGDRADLADDPGSEGGPADLPASPLPGPTLPADADVEPVDEERFVPPPPPPVPRPDNRRLAAWLGVLGVPLLLLVLLIVSLRPPALVSYALVAWFVGGFAYLVLVMPRGPRDPDDNGARL